MTNTMKENKNTDTVAQGAGETRVEKCVCGHDELNHFAFGEEPPRKSGCDAPNCECYGFTLPAVTAHPPQDAVAQARERLVLTFGGEGYTSLPEVEAELDALIAAVRAEEREAFRLAALSDEIMRHETPDSRITRRDVQITELKAQLAAVRKEVDDLSEANWIMQKRLAMAEAEIVRLGGGG